MNLTLPLVRLLLPGLRGSRFEGPTPASDSTPPGDGGRTSLLYALRAVTLAWDRHRLLVRARRWAAGGFIVLCDRYPSDELGAMDSPRLRESQAKGGFIATLHNWLVQAERQLYREIPAPDTVLRLRVSVETAKRRNRERVKAGKETSAYVESRHCRNKPWHKLGTKEVHDIDTEGSLEEVISTVKGVIWESL